MEILEGWIPKYVMGSGEIARHCFILTEVHADEIESSNILKELEKEVDRYKRELPKFDY